MFELTQIDVTLELTRGRAGGDGQSCTFRYDVYHEGRQIAHDADPREFCYTRPGGALQQAYAGHAFMMNGELIGLWPDEVEAVDIQSA